jgi:hypothetical protein
VNTVSRPFVSAILAAVVLACAGTAALGCPDTARLTVSPPAICTNGQTTATLTIVDDPSDDWTYMGVWSNKIWKGSFVKYGFANGNTYTIKASDLAGPGIYQIAASAKWKHKNGWEGYKNDGAYWGPAARFTVMKVETRSAIFRSDHGRLTDWKTNFARSRGRWYKPRGWQKTPPKNNPISHTQGKKVTLWVGMLGQPAGLSCTVEGDGPIAALDFAKKSFTSTGSPQSFQRVSKGKLPKKVDILNHPIQWTSTIAAAGNTCTYGDKSGPHKIYVTWGRPRRSTPTEKRIEWVCTKAKGQNSKVKCCDKLWDGVAADANFGSGRTDGWALLDGGSGDCDNLARCMMYAVEVLGAGPATVRAVCASTNKGAGKCLDLETRWRGGRRQYLVMDFDTGPGYKWNAYEGCCVTAGHYYAVEPKKKAKNDYKMLKAISCQQYWVLTNTRPGRRGWRVLRVFEEVPKT